MPIVVDNAINSTDNLVDMVQFLIQQILPAVYKYFENIAIVGTLVL